MVTVVMIAGIVLLAVVFACFAALQALGEHFQNVAAHRRHNRPVL